MYWKNRTFMPNTDKFISEIKDQGLLKALDDCKTIKEKIVESTFYKKLRKLI